MSFFRRLTSFEDDLDFRRAWRFTTVLSLVLVLGSIAAISIRGLNFGIDFEGGTSMDITGSELTVEDARDALEPLGESDARIQTFGRGDDTTLRIQTATTDEAAVAEIRDALEEAGDLGDDDVSVSTVGPSWGEQITDKAQRALILFLIAISAYIAIRLEWKMAIGALVSVAHDILISVGFYALLQFPVTPSTVISFLTILGYSIYDTIVVFDRVQENTGNLTQSSRRTYTQAMSLSLNQVIMRSLNTTICSMLPVLAILIVGAGILGAAILQEFALALAVGLIAGAYSSIFVACPLVAWIKEREPKMRELRERVAARGGPVVGEPVPAVATAAGAVAPTRPRTASTDTPTPTTSPSGRTIPPRPRKKGRRR